MERFKTARKDKEHVLGFASVHCSECGVQCTAASDNACSPSALSRRPVPGHGWKSMCETACPAFLEKEGAREPGRGAQRWMLRGWKEVGRFFWNVNSLKVEVRVSLLFRRRCMNDGCLNVSSSRLEFHSSGETESTDTRDVLQI